MSELMAMLAAGSPPITSVRGSQKSITPSDVAACLHTCNRFTYLFGLAKFSLDNSSRQELNTLAVLMARRQCFKLSESESKRVPDLLGLVALRLAVGTNKCPKCRGVGELKSASEVVKCPLCSGDGNKKLSIRKLEKILEVSRWRSEKVWQPRLTILLSEYAVMESDIQDSIYRGLRE
jgi:hypothetical protein